jgi:transposase
VLFGAVNLRTGRLVLLCRVRQKAPDFCAFLHEIRRRYRGRHVALLLDSDSSHTAHASRHLAEKLGVTLLWLPTRSPHLNPMDHLWRALKQNVSANRQDANIDALVARAVRYLRRLPPRSVLRKAGVFSRRFWLWSAMSKYFCRPT